MRVHSTCQILTTISYLKELVPQMGLERELAVSDREIAVTDSNHRKGRPFLRNVKNGRQIQYEIF